MKGFGKIKVAITTVATLSASTVVTYANSTVTNPISGGTSTVGSILNTSLKWLIGTVAAVAGSVFLFHLYKAILGFMAGSHQAQKREEAKSHLIWVAVTGVLLGGATVFASALYTLGGTFK